MRLSTVPGISPHLCRANGVAHVRRDAGRLGPALSVVTAPLTVRVYAASCQSFVTLRASSVSRSEPSEQRQSERTERTASVGASRANSANRSEPSEQRQSVSHWVSLCMQATDKSNDLGDGNHAVVLG